MCTHSQLHSCKGPFGNLSGNPYPVTKWHGVNVSYVAISIKLLNVSVKATEKQKDASEGMWVEALSNAWCSKSGPEVVECI